MVPPPATEDMNGSTTVIAKAVPELVRKGKEMTAAILGSAPDQIEFSDGRFSARDTNRSFDFLELAAEAATHALPPELKDGKGKKKELAKQVGKLVAKKCQEAKIAAVVFDRNGFMYHGRIAAVAEGAREGGLKF